ncbi:ABC transporter permease [Spartinivicinus poritis]|uniref:Transport permease protein n=1 Tax=Spartinivicinus poritis TaxID=2994640 RepID=A0ABT5UFL9_9GAMM|nr:ABC transporter permease [Spartinivicinus sp. A2-2]MDE1465171.1 ABC transporter permease [Spartinivicinus sp. A2-2]
MKYIIYLKNNRGLLKKLVKRDIESRYKGSLLGFLWAVITPLIMLSVYATFFTVVFKAKWGGIEDESKGMYAIIIYSGIIVHSFVAECLNRSSDAIVSNKNLVNKVVFPLEIIPVSMLGYPFISLSINTILITLAVVVINDGFLSGTIYFVILFYILMLFIGLSLCWIISSISVYVKDIKQVLPLITSLLMFISPIFYSVEILPPSLQIFMYINPLTYLIEVYRDIIIWGNPPNIQLLLFFTLVLFFAASLSFKIFKKLKKGFADVM